MRYMLLIYTDRDRQQQEFGGQGSQSEMGAYASYTKGLVDSGVMRSGDALQPETTATSVRVRNGQRVVSDGPFAETKEILGGFYIVEARDLDHAIELAAACPGARSGTIEVRPVWELPAEYQEAPGAVASVS